VCVIFLYVDSLVTTQHISAHSSTPLCSVLSAACTEQVSYSYRPAAQLIQSLLAELVASCLPLTDHRVDQSMAPKAPANNGAVVVAGGHHGGSTDVGGVAGGATTTTVPTSVAANGNGKQHGTRKQRRPAAVVVSPMDKYWTPVDDKEAAEAIDDGGEDGRRPLLFRTYKVKGILLHPYRCVLTSCAH
jgi:hypothetical protein